MTAPAVSASSRSEFSHASSLMRAERSSRLLRSGVSSARALPALASAESARPKKRRQPHVIEYAQ